VTGRSSCRRRAAAGCRSGRGRATSIAPRPATQGPEAVGRPRPRPIAETGTARRARDLAARQVRYTYKVNLFRGDEPDRRCLRAQSHASRGPGGPAVRRCRRARADNPSRTSCQVAVPATATSSSAATLVTADTCHERLSTSTAARAPLGSSTASPATTPAPVRYRTAASSCTWLT